MGYDWHVALPLLVCLIQKVANADEAINGCMENIRRVGKNITAMS